MTDAERQHLAAILGMLGSEHAGERAAAGLQAEAFRRKHRLTWPELLALPSARPSWVPPPETQQPASPPPPPKPAWTPPPPPEPPTYYPPINWRAASSSVAVAASYVALMAAPLTIALLVRLFN